MKDNTINISSIRIIPIYIALSCRVGSLEVLVNKIDQ